MTCKKKDNNLALMAYQVTPLECGKSPTELLMSSVLQANVPLSWKELQPKVPNLSTLHDEQKIKERQKHNFNSTHDLWSLVPLNVGDDVWLPKEETSAKVQWIAGFRSYNVTTSNGNTMRRNRKRPITLPSQNDSNINQQRTSSGRIAKPPIRFNDQQCP